MPNQWAFASCRLKSGSRLLALRRFVLLLFGRKFPDKRPTGHLHDQVLSRRPIHPFPQPVPAFFGDQAWLIKLPDQIVQIVVGLENHVASPAPVATVGPALGTVLLAAKGHAAFSTVTRSGIQ